ncbi:MAG: hypothetical protein JWP18_321 [Solirubrobacterales bacterium]|nr:hypothetical protein [Solirubrobacterales bacterium]
MLERSADSQATVGAVWDLMARPANWSHWAPHVRGAWRLAGSDGTVREGARGAARLLGALPVPVVITEVRPGRSWKWRVAGIMDMDHRVSPRRAGGSTVTVTLDGPAPLRAALAVTYAPLVGVLVARLARIAER